MGCARIRFKRGEGRAPVAGERAKAFASGIKNRFASQRK